jgi:uncharacterized protein (DUF58 family)
VPRRARASFFEFLAERQTPAKSDAQGSFVLERRSLYILPTREGLYYGAMLGVILLAAINYSNGLAYALAFLLAAIAVVAILHTHRNLSRLRLSAGAARPVFAGELARFNISARNDSGVPRRAVEIAMGGQTHRFEVPARATTAIELTVPTAQRGYLELPPLTFRTRFPLGLWRAWSRRVALPAHCLVYPRPAPPQPLPEIPGLATGREMSRNTESEEFAGLREYRAGDPVQRIAWKKVAAGLGWHTKQFLAPAGRQIVWLDWNALPIADPEERLSLLCRWVLMGEQQEVMYGLRLPGVSLSPALGESHRDRCLECLALFESVDV